MFLLMLIKESTLFTSVQLVFLLPLLVCSPTITLNLQNVAAYTLLDAEIRLSEGVRVAVS